MRRISQHLVTATAALWIGGMWVVGYLVVPILFQSLADRQMAGMLAGKLFTVMNYVGLVCALYLGADQLLRHGRRVIRQPVFLTILVMAILLLASQFILQPWMAELKSQALPLEVMQSTFAQPFKWLHGVSSILYLLQSLLGLFLLTRLFAVNTSAEKL